jgi:hypothetical protein
MQCRQANYKEVRAWKGGGKFFEPPAPLHSTFKKKIEKCVVSTGTPVVIYKIRLSAIHKYQLDILT